VAATFATHAIISATLGPWMPRLKAQCGLDASGLGLALAGFAAGMVAGTRVAGPVLARASGRAVVRCAVPLLAATLALLPAAHGLAALTAIFTGLGLAGGLLDVAMNTEAVAVEHRFNRPVMSAMHGTWSVSGLAGAALASAGVAAGLPPTIHLPAIAAILIAASYPLLSWLPAKPAERSETNQPAEATAPTTSRAALLCLIGAAAFLGEGVVLEWSAIYLREEVGAQAGIAGLGVVAFSAGMTATRFTGDRLSARIEPRKLARAGASLAAIALAAALLDGGTAAAMAAFAVAGAGLGPIVPLAFRAAGDLSLARGRSALGVVVTASYIGSIAGPLAVGFLAAELGLRAAFAVPVITCAAIATAASALNPR